MRLFSRFGLRYYAAERELTLMTDVEDATGRHARTWLVFPPVEVQIFIPNDVRWDGGQPLTEEEKTLLLRRLDEACVKLKEHYRVVVGDEIYEQIQTLACQSKM